VHSQPSVASSNATLVVPATTSPLPARSPLKRRRAEDDEGGEETGGAAPAQRPRSESYVAPEGDVPGLWDWLKMPWKSFVRGLALGSRSATLSSE
jgi:hypothetical protein